MNPLDYVLLAPLDTHVPPSNPPSELRTAHTSGPLGGISWGSPAAEPSVDDASLGPSVALSSGALSVLRVQVGLEKHAITEAHVQMEKQGMGPASVTINSLVLPVTNVKTQMPMDRTVTKYVIVNMVSVTKAQREMDSASASLHTLANDVTN